MVVDVEELRLMIGKMLGQYRIIEKLGAGGMGIVYKARDLRLDRFVALKVLSPEKVSDAIRTRRFKQEARAASALNHPNIITIHNIDHTEGIDFIVMEYVAGKTLDERIGHRALSLNDTLKYAVQIADALNSAHAAGIIHRDLKPSNVMVDEHGLIKVLDFGLAKLTEIPASEEETATYTAEATTGEGAIVGTVAYMSPEQAEGRKVDARSDIFSLGSLLYEMVTGRRAFQGNSKVSTLAAVIEHEPEPLGSDIPRDLERVIMRSLRKDPDRRFQHMDEMKIALEDLKAESDSGRSASKVSAPVRDLGKVRFRRTITIAVGLVLMLLAGTAIVIWFSQRSTSKLADQAPPAEHSRLGRLSLLVSLEGQASDPALSPDGKMIAYVAEDQGRVDLFMRRVAGGGRIRLTNDEAPEATPSFSHDGERIAYTVLGPVTRRRGIWVIPTLGGQSNHVIDNATEATWSPDGSRLAFVLRRPGEGEALATCAADGTDPLVVMRNDANYPFFRHPSWSPDGKQLAVTRSNGGITGEIWLVPLKSGSPRRLSNDSPGVFSNQPAFTADGRGLVHESNRAGATNLWLLPSDGGPSVQLTSGPGPDTSPSVARDGSIAFVNGRMRCGLIVHNLSSALSREILTHSSFIWGPAFAPDGRELAFSRAEQDGAWHVWIVPLQGGAARQLTSGALPEIYPRFTPDGASVIYHTWSPGPDRIWRVPRAGGSPVSLTEARQDDDQYGDISPDGLQIAFARTENAVTRIYVAPINGGAARRLTDSPSTLPRWSPDGQWIAFSKSRGILDGVFVIGARGTEMRQLSEKGGWPVWWPDGKRLGFQYIEMDGSEEIYTVPFAGGISKPLRAVQFNGTNNPFDFSPDGTLLATSKCVTVSSEIWLVEPKR